MPHESECRRVRRGVRRAARLRQNHEPAARLSRSVAQFLPALARVGRSRARLVRAVARVFRSPERFFRSLARKPRAVAQLARSLARLVRSAARKSCSRTLMRPFVAQVHDVNH